MDSSTLGGVIILVIFLFLLLSIYLSHKKGTRGKAQTYPQGKFEIHSRTIQAYSLTAKGILRVKMLDDTPISYDQSKVMGWINENGKITIGEAVDLMHGRPGYAVQNEMTDLQDKGLLKRNDLILR